MIVMFLAWTGLTGLANNQHSSSSSQRSALYKHIRRRRRTNSLRMCQPALASTTVPRGPRIGLQLQLFQLDPNHAC